LVSVCLTISQKALVCLKHRKVVIQMVLVERDHERQECHVAHVGSISRGHRDTSTVVGEHSEVCVVIK
jgi:hypothetical protein